jgi:transcription-repair coupling factor (superfamily II helicase)
LPPELDRPLRPIAGRGRKSARNHRDQTPLPRSWDRKARGWPQGGAVISLRENRFANPADPVELIQRHPGTLKLRPDQKIVYLSDWHDAKIRLTGAARLAQALAKIAPTAQLDAGAVPQPTPGLVRPRAARRA